MRTRVDPGSKLPRISFTADLRARTANSNALASPCSQTENFLRRGRPLGSVQEATQ